MEQRVRDSMPGAWCKFWPGKGTFCSWDLNGNGIGNSITKQKDGGGQMAYTMDGKICGIISSVKNIKVGRVGLRGRNHNGRK